MDNVFVQFENNSFLFVNKTRCFYWSKSIDRKNPDIVGSHVNRKSLYYNSKVKVFYEYCYITSSVPYYKCNKTNEQNSLPGAFNESRIKASIDLSFFF